MRAHLFLVSIVSDQTHRNLYLHVSDYTILRVVEAYSLCHAPMDNCSANHGSVQLLQLASLCLHGTYLKYMTDCHSVLCWSVINAVTV